MDYYWTIFKGENDDQQLVNRYHDLSCALNDAVDGIRLGKFKHVKLYTKNTLVCGSKLIWEYNI